MSYTCTVCEEEGVLNGVRYYSRYSLDDDGALHPINSLETVIFDTGELYCVAFSEIPGYFRGIDRVNKWEPERDGINVHTSAGTIYATWHRPIRYKPKEPFFNEDTVIRFGEEESKLRGDFVIGDFVVNPFTNEAVQIDNWHISIVHAYGRYDYLDSEQMEAFGVDIKDTTPFLVIYKLNG